MTRWIYGTGLYTLLLRWKWWRSLSPAERYLIQTRISSEWLLGARRRP
tara:strand:+ start:2000 stop:2143 length:144 start_codon:yes stop_codon:yes gene_type:complete